MIYFSTRSFEPDQRRDAWGGILAQHCGPFEFEARYGLEAQMERHMIAGFPCVRMAQNSQYMRRSRRELERTLQDYYYVMLQVAGRSRISQCGSEADMAPGSLVVLDSGRPLEMQYTGKNVHLCFHLPRSLLEGAGRPSPPIGRGLSGPSALLVGSLMQEAFANASAFDDMQSEAIRDSLVSLIRATFTSTEYRIPQESTAVSNSSQMLRIIHAYIGRHLDAENLSPRTIAHACGVSVRHIHRLFKGSDTSLAGWVRRSRLDRCAADLRNGAMQSASITDIAFRWGFNDLAHFSRSFSAEFGQSPRDYRADALAAGRCSDPLDLKSVIRQQGLVVAANEPGPGEHVGSGGRRRVN